MADTDSALLISVSGGVVTVQQPPDNTVSSSTRSLVITSQVGQGHILNAIQGHDFSVVVEYLDQDGNDIDLSGYFATLQVRKVSQPDGELVAELSIIIIGNQLTCTLDGDDIDEIGVGCYEYDLLVIGDYPIRLLRGLFIVNADS